MRQSVGPLCRMRSSREYAITYREAQRIDDIRCKPRNRADSAIIAAVLLLL